ACRGHSPELSPRGGDKATGSAPAGLLALGEGAGRPIAFGTGSEAALSEREGELWWRERPLLAVQELRLRGRHNVENAMAAAAACLARGVEREAVRAGLRSFSGVAHRLEEVATLEGVLYVNDS